MWKRMIFAFLPILLLIALPVLMRPRGAGALSSAQTEKLVIVTAHTESIKSEFTEAFRKFYREKYGADVEIDWRNVGGTSDIVRYLNDRYEAAFHLAYPGEWNDAVAGGFKNPKTIDPDAVKARHYFQNSDVGIGIDLFFGGGTYDHAKMASAGITVDTGLRKTHPELFDPAVYPQSIAGEQIYDPQGRYYGTCLSSFGICYNLDRLNEPEVRGFQLKTWRDLGDPVLFQKIAVADPTKSGSITKCFEMILQKIMASAPDPKTGWQEGFLTIKRIAANSRYVTDSAGKLVRDVSSGSVAAGMCIDFYGLSEAEWVNAHSEAGERIRYLMPMNGTAITADPISLLRGAPNSRAAIAFIEFQLSPAGQKIWMFKPGTPGGPVRHALRRPAVRRDLFEDSYKAYRSDPDYNPYESVGTFAYNGALTGRYFTLIRVLIKDLALDPMDDLREAWREILLSGGPDRNPEAMAELNAMPVSYEEAGTFSARLYPSGTNTVTAITAMRRSWMEFATAHYRKAAELARAKRKGVNP